MVPGLNPRDIEQKGELRKDGSLIFSRDELEILMRLSGLFVAVNRSFGAVGSRLTSEQRDEIEVALDRTRAASSFGQELPRVEA